MKYRKKPVVVEAFRMGIDTRPDWFTEAVNHNIITTYTDDPNQDPFTFVKTYCLISTLEGKMKGDYGDFIIQGVKGEIYACKPEIFEMTYEPVAMLTLPEEKKNTMENMTKEDVLNDKDLRGSFYSGEYAPFVFRILEKFSLYKDNPTTASDSVKAAQLLKSAEQEIKSISDKLAMIEISNKIIIRDLHEQLKEKEELINSQSRLIDGKQRVIAHYAKERDEESNNYENKIELLKNRLKELGDISPF